MYPTTNKNVNTLHEQMDTQLSEFIVKQLHGPDNDTGPKLMSDLINILEELHARTIIVTTMSFMQARAGGSSFKAETIRQFVTDCEEDFCGNLRTNLLQAIKKAGITDDIFDVNAELRREILNDNA